MVGCSYGVLDEESVHTGHWGLKRSCHEFSKSLLQTIMQSPMWTCLLLAHLLQPYGHLSV